MFFQIMDLRPIPKKASKCHIFSYVQTIVPSLAFMWRGTLVSLGDANGSGEMCAIPRRGVACRCRERSRRAVSPGDGMAHVESTARSCVKLGIMDLGCGEPRISPRDEKLVGYGLGTAMDPKIFHS